MMHLDEILDLAVKKQSLKSDRQLSQKLGYTGNPTTQWRTKRTWPSDETMIKIANLAEINPEEALLWLNIWRSDGAARSIYEKIASRTIQGVAILGVSSLATFGFQPKPAEALTILEKVETQSANNVYYGKLFMKISRKVSSAWQIVADRFNKLFPPVMAKGFALAA